MELEKNMLKLSALGGLFFAVLGIVWGISIKSSMIMFDGLYSLISLCLTVLAMWITEYINKNDFKKFPFGKVVLEPITVALMSIVLILMCSINFIDAFQEILLGGNTVDTDLALGYSLISSIGCGIVYYIMNKKGKSLSSDILSAESNQWLMDTILSVAVLGGFIISLGLQMTQFAYLSKYIDPLMVIITSSIFVKIPIETLVKSFKEIINENTDEEINSNINSIAKSIEDEYNFEDSIVRVSKTGRELRVEIDFVFNEESKLNELDEMDKVREKIANSIEHIKLDKWLNINFTGDKKWAI